MKQPCPGLTMRRTPAGIPVVRLHYSADPALTPEAVAALKAKYSSEAMFRKEMEIDYGAMGGALVYPQFDPSVHVVRDSEIPKHGCRFMALDPHPRAPHAALWVTIDPVSDWWVTRELWPSVMYGMPGNLTDHIEENSYPIRYYAEAIAALEGNYIEWRHPETDREYGIYRYNDRGERIVFRLMDQAGKGFRASGEGTQVETYSTRYARFGLQFRDPKKAHQSGEDAVRDLLKLRGHDTKGRWPRLHIAESCVELIYEFGTHKYRLTKTVSDERDLKEDAAKSRCHLLDCLRYLANSQAQYIPRLAS